MASDTGGVKPFSIQGRLYRERERLTSMTDEERAWRKQWVRDQVLHNEPIEVPQIYKELNNPIRRMYKAPLDALTAPLKPVIGDAAHTVLRWFSGKFIMGAMLIYAGHYYFKYNAHDWTRKGGWRVTSARAAVYPGEPGYPFISDRTKGSHYGTYGFDKSPI